MPEIAAPARQEQETQRDETWDHLRISPALTLGETPCGTRYSTRGCASTRQIANLARFARHPFSDRGLPGAAPLKIQDTDFRERVRPELLRSEQSG